MKIRILMISSAAIGTAIACSAPSSEPAAISEQRFTGADDGGAGEAGEDSDAQVSGCAHAICASGPALLTSCGPCAMNVCARDPYCCATAWDETCVGEVTSICGLSCITQPPREEGANTCIHPVCATGSSLESACAPCVTSLCELDPYCCGVLWDATCVGEVGSICGQTCN